MTMPPPAAARLPRTVFLLMLVVACAHFNRIGISVAGTERIIYGYGISPEKMGLVYSAYLAIYTQARSMETPWESISVAMKLRF